MTWALWKRELRGGRRGVLGQPWFIPGLLLITAMGQLLIPGAWDALMIGGLPSVYSIVLLPQLALLLWIIVRVAASFVRERRTGMSAGLAVTWISPRRISVAKTFGGTWPAMLVTVILAALEVHINSAQASDMTIRAIRPAGDSEPFDWALYFLMGRLGHLVWADAYFMESAATAPSALAEAFLHIELPLRALLLCVSVATLTAWIAALMRSAAAVFFVTIGVIVGVFGCAAGIDFVFYNHVLERDMPLMSGALVDGGALAPISALKRQVWLELAYDATARYLIPLLWVAWWWRWSGKGFEAVYLRED